MASDDVTFDDVLRNRSTWIEMLEDGGYEQANGALHRGGGGYCCLGIGVIAVGFSFCATDHVGNFLDQAQSEQALAIRVDEAATSTRNPSTSLLNWEAATRLGLWTIDGQFETYDGVPQPKDMSPARIGDRLYVPSSYLTALNDVFRLSFKEIAAVIRDEPRGLLVKREEWDSYRQLGWPSSGNENEWYRRFGTPWVEA